MSHQSAVFVGRGADVIIKCEIFKADTQAFQKCRQLTVLLWMTVLLAKHVFWYPTQQTNFHLSMYWLFLTAIQSTVMISGQPYTLGRFDTAGQEDDDDLRYPQTNVVLTSMVAQMVKNLPAVWKTQVRSLGQEDPLEKGMATHCSILAWRIPWAEEPGWLQSMESQSVGHDWVTNTYLDIFLVCLPLGSSSSFKNVREKWVSGTSLVVQWLRLCASNAWGLGSIPGWGTRSSMEQLRPGTAKWINVF